MQRFNTDYIAVHANQLISILNTAEEIPLFHVPNMAIHDQEGELSAYANGVDVHTLDIETVEGVIAARDVAIGRISLLTLMTETQMSLFSQTYDSLNEAGKLNLSEDEKSQMAAGIVSGLKDMLDKSQRYASTTFTILGGEEECDVRISRLGDEEQPYVARKLELARRDQYIERNFLVGQIGWKGPEGEVQLSSTVRISPRDDPELRSMEEFFLERDDAESKSTLFGIFSAHLMDAEPEGIEAIKANYSGTELEQVESFIQLMLTRADQAKANSMLLKQHPDVQLPTSEQLDAYANFIYNARS